MCLCCSFAGAGAKAPKGGDANHDFTSIHAKGFSSSRYLFGAALLELKPERGQTHSNYGVG